MTGRRDKETEMTTAFQICVLMGNLFIAGYAVGFMVSQFRGLVREMRK